jgi:hypothetical protein
VKIIPKSLVACVFVLFMVARAAAQYPDHAVTNVGLSLGLSAQDGRWSYYLLSLSASPEGKITGGGSRHDVGPGAANIAPSNSVAVDVLESATMSGSVAYSTNSSTFTRKIGKTTLTLSNEVVSGAAFFSIPLSDGGLLKGAFVHNVDRRQTVRRKNGELQYGWKTNATWYAGQVFGSFDGLTGSTLLGE